MAVSFRAKMTHDTLKCAKPNETVEIRLGDEYITVTRGKEKGERLLSVGYQNVLKYGSDNKQLIGLAFMLDFAERAELNMACDDEATAEDYMQSMAGRIELLEKNGAVSPNGTEGFLMKKGGGKSLMGKLAKKMNRAWKRRFFSLKNGLLSYSEDENAKTLKSINIMEITGATQNKGGKDGDYLCLQLPEREFRIKADMTCPNDELTRWQKAIAFEYERVAPTKRQPSTEALPMPSMGTAAVEMQEFKGATITQRNPLTAKEEAKPHTEKVKNALDLDGNGNISREEWTKHYGNDNGFNGYDLNKDGVVTADEFDSAISKEREAEDAHIARAHIARRHEEHMAKKAEDVRNTGTSKLGGKKSKSAAPSAANDEAFGEAAEMGSPRSGHHVIDIDTAPPPPSAEEVAKAKAKAELRAKRLAKAHPAEHAGYGDHFGGIMQAKIHEARRFALKMLLTKYLSESIGEKELMSSWRRNTEDAAAQKKKAKKVAKASPPGTPVSASRKALVSGGKSSKSSQIQDIQSSLEEHVSKFGATVLSPRSTKTDEEAVEICQQVFIAVAGSKDKNAEVDAMVQHLVNLEPAMRPSGLHQVTPWKEEEMRKGLHNMCEAHHHKSLEFDDFGQWWRTWNF